MSNHRFDAFGKEVLIEWEKDHWTAYYVGTDGKRRSATDIVIPASVAEADLAQYLADLCHECATEQRPDVRRLD